MCKYKFKEKFKLLRTQFTDASNSVSEKRHSRGKTRTVAFEGARHTAWARAGRTRTGRALPERTPACAVRMPSNQ